MFNLNNKGQSLSMFIILIPIFVIVITLVFDVGSAIYEKNKLSNVCYMVVDYGLDNIEDIDENDLIDLILKNLDDLSKINVNVGEDINILLSKDIEGTIGRMFGFDLITANSQCVGKFNGKDKIIERIK